jgi:mRNA interferase RelE/StbE
MAAAYAVYVAPAAARDIKHLDRKAKHAVVATLESPGQQPRPSGVEKLHQNPSLWRVRVGHFRVIFLISDTDKRVIVARVRHRKDAYHGIADIDPAKLVAAVAKVR